LNLEENQQEKRGLSSLGQSEPVPTSTIQDGWMVCGQETILHCIEVS
jgi:hypothetical protein